MNQTELNRILEEHKKWLKNPSEGKKADLYEVDLSGANLSYANLYKANLAGANLSKANLSYADLSRATLFESNLSCANLSNVYLHGTNLPGADLSGVNLKDITFNYVWLSECNYETFIKQSELTEYFLVKSIYYYMLYKDFSLLEKALKDKREIIRIVRNN